MKKNIKKMQHADQLEQEQLFLNSAYELLDNLKKTYRKQQAKIHKKGARGTHQERTERDAFSSYYGDEASRLEKIQDKLVFGKLYKIDGKQYHIGRVGLRSNVTNTQILIDWRSKAAMPFYQATTIDNKDTAVRRHIVTKQRKVIDIKDEILATDFPIQQIGYTPDNNSSTYKENNTSNCMLVGENILMDSLSNARTNKMVDIVSTIQKEQDEIIRSSDKIVLVQGGPGTGKTAVALHRGAFILYAKREQLKNRGVLVIGPSKTFLEYVDNVLPSLGETGVVSSTIYNLRHDLKFDFMDDLDIAQIKGDFYWKTICENAVKNLRKIPETTQKIRVDSTDLYLYPKEIKKATQIALANYTTHNQARTIFVKNIIESLVKQYKSHYIEIENNFSDEQWMYESIRSNPQIQRKINLCWLPCTPKILLHWLYKHPDFLKKCAPNFSHTTINKLFSINTKISNNDIAILDYLDKLLGNINNIDETDAISKKQSSFFKYANQAIEQSSSNGIVTANMLQENSIKNYHIPCDLNEKAKTDPNWVFGHIIVDEAQELTPMQWQMLVSRCPSLSFTIVGDLDQRRINNKMSSWENSLKPIFKTDISEKLLTISYRTPKTIMKKATEFMKALNQKIKYPINCVRDIENSYTYSIYKDSLKSPIHKYETETNLVFNNTTVENKNDAKNESQYCTQNHKNSYKNNDTSEIKNNIEHNNISGNTDLQTADKNEYIVHIANKIINLSCNMDTEYGKTLGKLAVIFDSNSFDFYSKSLNKLLSNSMEDFPENRIVICKACDSKGLEFDYVVLVDPDIIAKESVGDLYVGMTRATKRLHVISYNKSDLPL